MRKIRAYTILEMTVAMILAGISMATAYTAYGLLGRAYQQYDDKNEKMAESLLLDKLLRKDFMEAAEIKSAEERLMIQKKDGIVEYMFKGDIILRTQFELPADTFFIRNENLKCFFKRHEVNDGELLDRLSFVTLLQNDSVHQCYRKQYSSEELFK